MNGLIIGLAASGAGFIILSFFMKDKQRKLEKDLEELSMQVLQEHYQLNKKLKIIEEELLISDPTPSTIKTSPVNQIIQNQVVALYNQGIDLQQIAGQSSLTVDQVKKILAVYQSKRKESGV
ncbi:helix-turn-helix domain-containing protein [Domibacillus epiphyticus]|uniref:Resolvase HTH domain-containing protein n=1 Tax=Domibacillus epiphyticus TaxID=1714355 RepID=A0A1V2AA24_9BACI|nr:helix-turn-helix domain-containing protein [Domibacillus epiphyticus]OMP67674.1 hypothetical protein BTO28_06950 [Domibacillus epiphyticus]